MITRLGKAVQEIFTNETFLFWTLAVIFATFIASYVYLALEILTGLSGAIVALLLFLALGSVSLYVLQATRQAMIRKISHTRRK